MNTKPFKDFTEDRKKTDWTIIFHQIFTLLYGLVIHYYFFHSSGKMPFSNTDLKSNSSGKTISFPHNWIILVDMSHPWALSVLRLFIIRKMSFSLTVKEFKRLSVLYLNFGNGTCIFSWSTLGSKMRIKKFRFYFWNHIRVCHQQE